MKKTLIALMSIIAIAATTGCSNGTTEVSNEQTTTPIPTAATSETQATVAEYFDIEEIEEDELKKKYLELYAEKSKDEKFISDFESSVYEEYEFDITDSEYGWITFYDTLYHEEYNYYKPIVLTGTDDIIVAGVDNDGELCSYNLTKDDRENYWINIHGNFSDEEEIIDSTESYAITYSQSKVSLWDFGEKVSEVELPNVEYTGYSYWEGYIFRHEGDVYSVKIDDNGNLTSEPIAHDVESVIVTDYKLTSDAWSQPLFLMQDGTIKAYCVWRGDQEAPRDDESHLVAPEYEGGYK